MLAKIYHVSVSEHSSCADSAVDTSLNASDSLGLFAVQGKSEVHHDGPSDSWWNPVLPAIVGPEVGLPLSSTDVETLSDFV